MFDSELSIADCRLPILDCRLSIADWSRPPYWSGLGLGVRGPMTAIHLAAMVIRDGRLWLVREHAAAPWSLPGGPLESDDVDAAMDEILAAHGLSVPAIEEDFVETIHLPDGADHIVYNIYAPMDWTGEPVPPSAHAHEWFELEAIGSLEMDPHVRDAILEALGLRERPDRSMDVLAAFESQFEKEHGLPSWLLPDDGPPTTPRDRWEPQPGDGPEWDPFQTKHPWDALPVPGRAAFDEAGTALGPKIRALAMISTLSALGENLLVRELTSEAVSAGATEAEIAAALEVAAACAGFPAAMASWPATRQAIHPRGWAEP